MSDQSWTTILIAEDDHAQLFVLELFLKKWGYEVISATDGLEALRLLRQPDAPRFAILDWHMPGLEGIAVCQQLRMENGNNRTVPYILLLSAKSQTRDVQRGLDAGANDYLTKPYDPQELHQKIQSGFRFLESSAQEVLTKTNQPSAGIHVQLPSNSS